MKEYKLFNTDGKTFFDFRSDPESRCEGFTITYCDDGTVVVSGDYGTLCWKRYTGQNRKDYGFPGKYEKDETNIRYFEEKVCQWGVEQKIKEWNKEKAIEDVKEYYSEEKEVLNKILEDVEYLEDYEEQQFMKIVHEHDESGELPYECGMRYTNQFKLMFERIKSVSNQIWDAVEKNNNEKNKKERKQSKKETITN